MRVERHIEVNREAVAAPQDDYALRKSTMHIIGDSP